VGRLVARHRQHVAPRRIGGCVDYAAALQTCVKMSDRKLLVIAAFVRRWMQGAQDHRP